MEAARRELGTKTVKDTVNEALRKVARERHNRQIVLLDEYPSEEIDEFLAWRRYRETKLGIS